MVSIIIVQKLRRHIQDFYSKQTGEQLGETEYAFKDEELEDILTDAFAIATDGARDSASATPLDMAMAMLLARWSALLQIAGDESRRVKWQINNEVIDPSSVAENLERVAKSLYAAYEAYRKRTLEAEVKGVATRPTGGRLDFNDTVKRHYERNFDNATVRRNRSIDH